ncbi:MAG: hypothetical protein PHQ05_08375 [Sterolibacterium sp.]|nr:hypothetical protein [Sterolibacterium sp.]
MNRIWRELIAACLAGLISLMPAAHSQSMSGMVAPINQVEAIEGHLQQLRTQSNRETEENLKKNSRTFELPKPITNTSEQIRAEGKSGKPRAPAGNSKYKK